MVRGYLLFYILSQFLSGAILSMPKEEAICEELRKSNWSIDSIRKVPASAWPLECPQLFHNNNKPVSQPISNCDISVYDSAAKGYPAFVQYVEKMDAPLNETCVLKNHTVLDMAVVNGYLNFANLSEYIPVKEELEFDTKVTALHIAAFDGKLEVVRFLVGRLNYKVDVRDSHSYTPTHYAAEGGHLSVLKYLVEEAAANVGVVSKTGCTLLELARTRGHLAVVKYLTDEKHLHVTRIGNECTNPIHFAVRGKRLDGVKYSIREKKANILESIKTDNLSASHTAAVGRDLNVKQFSVDNGKLVI